ncbi:protein transporter tim10 [Blastocladiella emersonii ATCC 22665]|nr:protein transporter tim10 [Blastocladiella emersonii ATCC 22665]
MSFMRQQQQMQMQITPALAAMEQQMDTMSDMFNRIGRLCHEKCIVGPYYEPTLTKGESVCTDRCVAKFFDVSYKVSAKLAGKQQPQ